MLFFPQRDILSRFGRYAIHGYACHSTNAVLIKQIDCLLVCDASQKRACAHKIIFFAVAVAVAVAIDVAFIMSAAI